jgi:hypothetical protein
VISDTLQKTVTHTGGGTDSTLAAVPADYILTTATNLGHAYAMDPTNPSRYMHLGWWTLGVLESVPGIGHGTPFYFPPKFITFQQEWTNAQLLQPSGQNRFDVLRFQLDPVVSVTWEFWSY